MAGRVLNRYVFDSGWRPLQAKFKRKWPEIIV